MSSLCLSSILTGANFAMYQTAVSDVVQPQPSSVNAIDNSNTAYISSLSGELLTFGSALCMHARVCEGVCLCVPVDAVY